MKKILTGAALAAVALSPFAVMAASSGPLTSSLDSNTTGLGGVIATVGNLINAIIPILIAIGVAYFIWGVVKYITAKDADSQSEARRVMGSGILGLFIILSIWGIIALLGDTFGIGVGGNIGGAIPTVFETCGAGQVWDPTYYDAVNDILGGCVG